MNFGYCKDCEHWNVKPWDKKSPYRECMRMREYEDETSLAKSYGYDWDGYGLLTRAEFGCAMFEAKP